VKRRKASKTIYKSNRSYLSSMDLLEKAVEEAAVELIRKAVTTLPEDVLSALVGARAAETSDSGRRELNTMIDNVREAYACTIPMCQDTGIPAFFVTMGRFAAPGVREAMTSAVRRATRDVPLRCNVVDPLSRSNTGDNTGYLVPLISYAVQDADFLEITYLPKGAGSENMSALSMLNPSAGLPGIRDFVVDTIVRAGSKPCPPVIVGVGIGGSSDICMSLAKKALLRPLGSHNPGESYRALENELLDLINRTGIGPMGLGGRTTALAVHVEQAGCHTASLPVGVNVQCYAARRASARIFEDGRVDFGGD
jgi:fumarate hydratase subunit alpha